MMLFHCNAVSVVAVYDMLLSKMSAMQASAKLASLAEKKRKLGQACGLKNNNFCGMYYKHITIINDD
jgi:hypothetical protein